MRFEESKYFELLPHSKIEFSFGSFYLCKHFVISEINEGIHFDWDKTLEVIGAAQDYYSSDIEIAYISNRVTAYSFEPQLWQKFEYEFGFIIAIAAVTYNDFGYINACIEKQFTTTSLKRCDNLSEAISWVRHLSEFSQN